MAKQIHQHTPVGIALPVPALWDAAITEFLAEMESAKRPVSSRKTYRNHLQHLARWTPTGPYAQDRDSLRAYQNAHPDWAQETARGRRQTMVSFYDWAMAAGHMADNPARALASIKPAAPKPRPMPEPVYQQALRQAPPRERLMLRMAHEMGMRRDEIAHSHSRDLWQDYDGEWGLTITGKGSKQREQSVPDSLARELAALPAGYWFPGNRSGHLSAEYVGRKLALLIPGEYTLHTARHSYATRMYELCGDLLTVQEALGHASPETTRRYVLSNNRKRIRQLNNQLAGPQAMTG